MTGVKRSFEILGIGYDNLTVGEALPRALSLTKGPGKYTLFFLNLDCLRIAHRDKEYRGILEKTSLVLPDGVGLRLATRLFGGSMKQDCNGSDFSPILLRAAADKNLKVFFLGGKDRVAEEASENFVKIIPNLTIVGTHSGYVSNPSEIVDRINRSGADILLVAMGVPLQEKWIDQNRTELNPTLCLGVGALFDWLSGRKKRAPWILRALYLEWFWRILIDFRRLFARYIIHDLGFLMFLFFYRLRNIKKQSPVQTTGKRPR